MKGAVPCGSHASNDCRTFLCATTWCYPWSSCT